MSYYTIKTSINNFLIFAVYLTDDILRVIPHREEHPPDIFTDYTECNKDDTGEDDDGHHCGCPAEDLGLADEFAYQQPDQAENSAQSGKYTEPLGKTERDDRESGDVGP